jgi:hypothetical protein
MSLLVDAVLMAKLIAVKGGNVEQVLDYPNLDFGLLSQMQDNTIVLSLPYPILFLEH